MKADGNHSSNLLRLLNDSLRVNPPVAPTELFYDSQTKTLIKELGKLSGQINLLDYGCGNLRLLQGIKATNSTLPKIKYVATDLVMPKDIPTELGDYTFIDTNNLRKDYSEKFDVIILMNVIHEISIHSVATIFEDVRRLLKPDGIFILIDMSILPEGEPLSLPFYSWEFEIFFKEYQDLSYNSKSGLPIICFKISKYAIPCYSKSIELLIEIVQGKRNAYSEVACQLHDPNKKAKYNWLIEKLSLTGNNLYDLGLLMLLSGHANYRWMEEMRRKSPKNEEVIETAITILQHFHYTFYKTGKIVSLKDIFQEIGSSNSYDRIRYAIMQMSNTMGCFFFPIREDDKPLQPTESMDAFDDHFSYDDIRKMGLFMIQQKCHNKMWP